MTAHTHARLGFGLSIGERCIVPNRVGLLGAIPVAYQGIQADLCQSRHDLSQPGALKSNVMLIRVECRAVRGLLSP